MISRSLAAAGLLVIAHSAWRRAEVTTTKRDPAATETAAKAVTIYSSYPLQGAGRAQSIAAVNGAKLALEQAGGKAGNVTVTYEPLDDATAQAANWTPEQTSANARKAAQDESTAVYLGEFNSGATAVSLPILNEAGIAQISPSNTAVGLTSDEPGANPGEPDKYYPTGQRTFARIVPKDTIQGAALATLMKEDGCTKVQLLNDKEVYGAGLARNIEASAKAQGLEILSNEATDKNAANFRSLAQKAKAAGADCMVFSGHHRQQRGAGLQGLRRRAAGREALRPRRRRGLGLRRQGGGHPGRGRRAHEGDDRHALARPVPARGPGVLRGSTARSTARRTRTRTRSTATRRWRSRWTPSSARETGEKADIVKALFETKDRALGARHVLDRRQRRHDADRLRHLRDQGRRARLRQDDQGEIGTMRG